MSKGILKTVLLQKNTIVPKISSIERAHLCVRNDKKLSNENPNTCRRHFKKARSFYKYFFEQYRNDTAFLDEWPLKLWEFKVHRSKDRILFTVMFGSPSMC